jgi:hypothetical protein
MRYRKLRIAWLDVCGIATVLLIVLWVLGYRGWYRHQLYFVESLAILTVYVALVMLVIVVGKKAPVYLRYSLRTLLIAMTLVAIGLGLIVWAAGS